MDTSPAFHSPTPGDIVHLRSRHYVIEAAEKGPHGTLIEAACLDDDAQGNRLHAIWEVALDRRIITEEAWESIGTKGFDPQESNYSPAIRSQGPFPRHRDRSDPSGFPSDHRASPRCG